MKVMCVLKNVGVLEYGKDVFYLTQYVVPEKDQ